MWLEKICFVSSVNIPNIHSGLTIHEELPLIAFFQNQPASLKSLKNCNPMKPESVMKAGRGNEISRFKISRNNETPQDTLEFCADLLLPIAWGKWNQVTFSYRTDCTVENSKSRPTLFPGITWNGINVEFFIFTL